MLIRFFFQKAAFSAIINANIDIYFWLFLEGDKMSSVILGFENKLWEMADKLRGNIESSEYKHVVLGLVFLKYISDSFLERYEEIKVEYPGLEEDRDGYTSKNG